eukprot:CAMPEP_0114347482 /NCGR_PEP_ID=MMETSP0101-20121206/13922_1 /TAXON_ID=38822 ORGANISM="Pteridomonas danica, Strain PT" /NCGR_SAMPLE_ID=MMETSP0101 /ASSEMBLY_ACC=CAM_ASM_000211 /LENGTH=727 /DNA_ID=CAMNT_0001484791 /DNA_START=145 /DNA_END=2329 /DNA_ORIENTATION=+
MKANGSLNKAIQNNPTSSTSTSTTNNDEVQSHETQPKKEGEETSSAFNFTASFGECMTSINILGNGCLEQFSACGMLWLLASFVFLDGYPALAFGYEMDLLVLVCATAVTVAAFLIDIGNGLLWLDPYGSTAIVSLVSLPLPFLLTLLTPKGNYVTLSLAPFIALFVIIPFGFTGSIATKGVLSVASVFTVIVWTSMNSFYAALGCAILPNFAIIAGALLRHGGEGPMLVGDKLGSLLPGGSLALCGLYYVIYGTCISKKQEMISASQKQQLKDDTDDTGEVVQMGDVPFYLDWVPPQFMLRCGAFALLLGLCYAISGFIGVIALFLLAIFVGGATMFESKSTEGPTTGGATTPGGGGGGSGDDAIVSDDAFTSLTKTVLAAKHQFAEVSIYLIFLATAMGVAYGEHCVHGIASSELAAVACVSISGFVLVLMATIFDREAQTIPYHIRDFLMYLWFVVGGLIGAAANNLGSLGVIVIVIGALYSFMRHHSLICVFVAPSLMFWAGVNLNKATGNIEPCIAIGTPVLIYALCEIIAAQILKCTNKDVLLKGPGAIPPSWANPKELVPFYFSSALSISGAFFLIAGSMGLMYCPGDKGGSLGIAGQLTFIFFLVFMGIYLLRNGLILRDDQDINMQQQSDGKQALNLGTQGLKLRVAGLFLINAAIWFAFPLTSSLALKAIVIVLGSMVLIISGCVSMYWKKGIDNANANTSQETNARNETLDNANAL